MDINPSFPALTATGPVARGDVRPANAVTASGAATASDASDQGQAPAAGAQAATPPDDGVGWVDVTEALYRLQSNWSPALHEGKSAIAALPRPDVIAAYHRDDVVAPVLSAEHDKVIAGHIDLDV